MGLGVGIGIFGGTDWSGDVWMLGISVVSVAVTLAAMRGREVGTA